MLVSRQNAQLPPEVDLPALNDDLLKNKTLITQAHLQCLWHGGIRLGIGSPLTRGVTVKAWHADSFSVAAAKREAIKANFFFLHETRDTKIAKLI